MKILVVTKYKWDSRTEKHKEITFLMKTGGITPQFITKHTDVGNPKVTDGRIDPTWFETYITKPFGFGYEHIIFQFSKADGKKWGLEDGLRGHNIKDADAIGESWVCCDEHDVVKFKDGSSRNKYTKTVPHEIAHELKNKGVTSLEVHDFDFKNDINNLEGFYKAMGEDVIKRLTAKVQELLKKVTKKQVNDLQPKVMRAAAAVSMEMNLLGLPTRITEGFRSIERQNELYAQGRTKPGAIVTQAKGGQSLHNYGVAVDFVFVQQGYNATDAQWKTLGTILNKHGFEWGGDWKGFVDKPHAEMRLGYTLADFQNGKVDYSLYL